MTGRLRREDGQAVTAAAVIAMLMVVAAALGMIFTFGKGTSEMSKIKSGADAAALAGAQQVVNDSWMKIDASLRSKKDEWNCGDGQGRAGRYASRNSTQVTSYCYLPMADRVEVQVVSKFVTETGKPEDARSVAEIGHRLGACVVVTMPSTTGYYTTATCGDLVVDVYVDSGGDAHLVTPEPALKKMFRVTLAE
jgi:hypothetical protein